MNISARTLIWWESWQGEAIANLLYGRVSPCGRLTESWPLTYEDVPSSEIFGKYKDALYQEGIYAGYRYYDKADVKVCWPFGYGLSYTDFTYRDLEISEKAENNIGTDRNGACDVSITVKNTGSRPGAEVVQLYIMPPEEKGGVRCGLHRPVRELKGFRKVFLQPGESTKVSFVLEERSFAVWQEGWKVPEGSYTVCIGGLSAAIEKEAGASLFPPGSREAGMKPARVSPP